MMRIWLLLFGLIAIPALAEPLQKAPRPDCAPAKTQQEMTLCAQQTYQAADKDLNQIYNQLLQEYDPNQRRLLREAQRAWLIFVDRDCALSWGQYRGGSMAQMVKASCSTRLTDARTVDLSLKLDEWKRQKAPK